MKKSLALKINSVIILLIIICSIAFIVASGIQIRSSVTNQMKHDGSTLIINVKREIIENNITGMMELQKVFQEIMAESKGNIQYVSMSDDQGNIIVSDNNEITQNIELGNVDAITSATAKGDIEKVVSQQVTMGKIIKHVNGVEVYNVSTNLSLGNEFTGALNLGISLMSMEKQIEEAYITIIIISVIIMAIAILIGTLLSKVITRPIILMSSKINTFSSGDFTVGFEHKSKDEIGSMGDALNQMQVTLKTMVEDIQKKCSPSLI